LRHASTFTDIRMVDVDGQMLRAGIRHGSSRQPPLVVFNGIGANLELLNPFVAALENITVVAFDSPGVGGSPAPLLPYRYAQLARLVDRLLHRLGFDGAVDVLGVSWGGALAQQYAHLHPERCRRLILAATAPGMIMVPGRLSVVRRLASPRRYLDPAHLRRIAPHIYGGAFSRDPALIDHHIRHIQPPRGRGYLYQLAAIWGWSSLPWLHRLRQPTLIMAGTEDPIVPLANAKILAALIRRAQLWTIDDGHLFLITGAREVAPVVLHFLAQPDGHLGRQLDL
jgi:poly(3-hydroxyalkanoate) depolymerase